VNKDFMLSKKMSDPIQLYDNPTKAARALVKTLVFQGSSHYVTNNKFVNLKTGANMFLTSMLTEFIVRDKIISTTGIASKDLNQRIALDMLLTIVQFYLGQYVYDGKMSLSDVIISVITSEVFASFGDFVAINAATGNTWYNTASTVASAASDVASDIIQDGANQVGLNRQTLITTASTSLITWFSTRYLTRFRIGHGDANMINNGPLIEEIA
jgi:hypothetical protein